MAVSGINSALAAYTGAVRRVERAATQVGATSVAAVDAPAPIAESTLPDGMVGLVVARSMLGASMALAESTNEQILESLKLGGY